MAHYKKIRRHSDRPRIKWYKSNSVFKLKYNGKTYNLTKDLEGIPEGLRKTWYLNHLVAEDAIELGKYCALKTKAEQFPNKAKEMYHNLSVYIEKNNWYEYNKLYRKYCYWTNKIYDYNVARRKFIFACERV